MDTCVFIRVHICAFQRVKSKRLKFQSRDFLPPLSSALSCILPGIFLPVQADVHFTKNIKMNPTNYYRQVFNNTDLHVICIEHCTNDPKICQNNAWHFTQDKLAKYFWNISGFAETPAKSSVNQYWWVCPWHTDRVIGLLSCDIMSFPHLAHDLVL